LRLEPKHVAVNKLIKLALRVPDEIHILVCHSLGSASFRLIAHADLSSAFFLHLLTAPHFISVSIV